MELGIYTEPEIERDSELTQSHITQQTEKFTWAIQIYGLTINLLHVHARYQAYKTCQVKILIFRYFFRFYRY